MFILEHFLQIGPAETAQESVHLETLSSGRTVSKLVGALSPVNHRRLHQG